MATETHKFTGHKTLKVSSVKLTDGTVLTKGGDAAEVPEDELSKLKAEGFTFRKSSDDGNGEDGEQQAPQTPADQLAAQSGPQSGAQHGTATQEGTTRKAAVERSKTN